MPDQKKTKAVEAKTTKLQTTKNVSDSELLVDEKDQQTNRWIVWAVIGGMLMLLGLVALAAAAYKHFSSQYAGHPFLSSFKDERRDNGFRGGYRWIEFRSSTSQSDGLNTTTTTTTYIYTQGVVTKADDDSITVAGGGKSQRILFTDDTVYVNSKPKVNDTVGVTSTKDGDELIATKVRIYN